MLGTAGEESAVGLQSQHQDLMGVPHTLSAGRAHIWCLFYLNKSLGGLILASNMLSRNPSKDRPKDFSLWGLGGTSHPSNCDSPQ